VNGYVRVNPTEAERDDYRASHGGFPPAVYRVRCLACGKRLWNSGLGIGSHNGYHKKQRAQAAWDRQHMSAEQAKAERGWDPR
jgi:hypothetical protein